MATMVDPTPAPPAEAPTPCDAPPTVTPTAWATCMGSRAGVCARQSTAKTSETSKTGKVFFTCAPFPGFEEPDSPDYRLGFGPCGRPAPSFSTPASAG